MHTQGLLDSSIQQLEEGKAKKVSCWFDEEDLYQNRASGRTSFNLRQREFDKTYASKKVNEEYDHGILDQEPT